MVKTLPTLSKDKQDFVENKYNNLVNEITTESKGKYSKSDVDKDLVDLEYQDFEVKYRQFIKKNPATNKSRTKASRVGYIRNSYQGLSVSQGKQRIAKQVVTQVETAPKPPKPRAVSVSTTKTKGNKSAIKPLSKQRNINRAGVQRKQYQTTSKGLKQNILKGLSYKKSQILPEQPVPSNISMFKNAWDLTGGVFGKSNNEVQYRVRVTYKSTQNPKAFPDNTDWVKFTSGVSVSTDIETLLGLAWLEFINFDNAIHNKSSVEVTYGRIDIVVIRDV